MKPIVKALERGGFRREKSPISGLVILSDDNLGPHAKVSLYDSSIGWDSEAPVQVGIIAGIFGHPGRSPFLRDLEETAFERAEDALKRAGIRLQGTNPHSKVVRMAHTQPSAHRVAFRALRRHKTAGWWDDTPLGGDTPLDILGVVEKESTASAAARKLSKYLRDRRDPSAQYGAMGVWDLVMSTDKSGKYVREFKGLTRDVKEAAKALLANYKWIEGWGGMSRTLKFYLEDNYVKGKPTGRLRGEFTPATPQWYIEDVLIEEANEDYVRVEVRLRNEVTGESKTEEATINTNEFEIYSWEDAEVIAEVFNSDYENYGGKPASGQQSVLLKIEFYDDDGNEGGADFQLDFDAVTGESRYR